MIQEVFLHISLFPLIFMQYKNIIQSVIYYYSHTFFIDVVSFYFFPYTIWCLKLPSLFINQFQKRNYTSLSPSFIILDKNNFVKVSHHYLTSVSSYIRPFIACMDSLSCTEYNVNNYKSNNVMFTFSFVLQ